MPYATEVYALSQECSRSVECIKIRNLQNNKGILYLKRHSVMRKSVNK